MGGKTNGQSEVEMDGSLLDISELGISRTTVRVYDVMVEQLVSEGIAT